MEKRDKTFSRYNDVNRGKVTFANRSNRFGIAFAATMCDMKKINANGYFDEGNNEEVRYQKKKALDEQITNLL